jgi:hypothetical protein
MAGVTSTHFIWNVPGGGTFNAKTFIVSQNLALGTFTGSELYQLAASPTVGGSFTDITGAGGTAGLNDSNYNVFSSSTATTVGKLQASMSSLVTDGTTSYAVMQEILAIPDQLTPITGNTAVADSSIGGLGASRAVDGKAATEWAAADGVAGHTLTITLGTPSSSVGAILFEGQPGTGRITTFDVYFDSDLSPTITGVTLLDGDTAVLKLTTPRTASSMKLLFGAENAGDVTAIEEVMPMTLAAVPEPASLSLLGLGALALLRRRRA